MLKLLDFVKISLEKIDHGRDRVIFFIVKPFWPQRLSPNFLSYTRIAIGVFIAILLFFFQIDNKFLILSLFAFGAVSDLFDGSVARCFNQTTDFGAMLDPAADRILILPIAIFSLYSSNKWLLLILLLAEGLNGILSIFYKSQIQHAKANIFGKARMVIISLVFIAILVSWPQPPAQIFISLIWISLIFTFLSMLTTLLELKNAGQIKI